MSNIRSKPRASQRFPRGILSASWGRGAVSHDAPTPAPALASPSLGAVALALLFSALGAVNLFHKVESFQPIGVRLAQTGAQSARHLGRGERHRPARGGSRPARRRCDPELVAADDSPAALAIDCDPHRLRGVELATIDLSTAPRWQLDLPYLVLAGTGIVYLLIGLWVMLHGRGRPAGIFFLWTLAAAMVDIYTWVPGLPMGPLAKASFLVEEVARLLLGPLTLHLFLLFPCPSSAPPWRRRLTPFLYLPAAVLAALQVDWLLFGGHLFAGAVSAAADLPRRPPLLVPAGRLLAGGAGGAAAAADAPPGLAGAAPAAMDRRRPGSRLPAIPRRLPRPLAAAHVGAAVVGDARRRAAFAGTPHLRLGDFPLSAVGSRAGAASGGVVHRHAAHRHPRLLAAAPGDRPWRARRAQLVRSVATFVAGLLLAAVLVPAHRTLDRRARAVAVPGHLPQAAGTCRPRRRAAAGARAATPLPAPARSAFGEPGARAGRPLPGRQGRSAALRRRTPRSPRPSPGGRSSRFLAAPGAASAAAGAAVRQIRRRSTASPPTVSATRCR